MIFQIVGVVLDGNIDNILEKDSWPWLLLYFCNTLVWWCCVWLTIVGGILKVFAVKYELWLSVEQSAGHSITVLSSIIGWVRYPLG